MTNFITTGKGFVQVALICFLILGCKDGISSEDLAHLNGYWEIERVVFDDGTEKLYKVSSTVDYIELKGSKGFRKKVRPKFDGTYDTSDDAISFSVSASGGLFHLDYENGDQGWHEQLNSLDPDHFSVTNDQDVRYDYKRFEAIKVTKQP